MDKNNFKKLNKQEETNISGGSIVTTFVTLAPVIFSGISTISNIIKMFSSSNGEVKTKDNSLKWSNDNSSNNNSKTIYYYY
ncbi:hypothetical protein ACLRE7_01575 [Mycoplasmopsis meleagridis]|uniref:hypothetical protein n=1 Tax=Mycoplasmopsis meleagridis TaxID=29561 RepID=UPI00073DB40D|nr:hypothetical protein [Mycoplasmopsis meleagridis]KUH47425.1 hypothetical protein ASB56_00960 [Mycoplasmopsis meleagridis]